MRIAGGLSWSLLFLLSVLSGHGPAAAGPPATDPVFRLTLFSEPASLSPFVQKNSGSLYLLAQLSCPLLKMAGDRPQSWGGRCRIDKQKVDCEVDSELRFQNDKPVTVEHYAQSFRAFLDPKRPSPRADLLEQIQNARAVLKGEKPISALGIQVRKGHLIFSVTGSPNEFLLTLANPLFSAVWTAEIPSREKWKDYVSCGPYQIESWTEGKEIRLAPQQGFPKGHPERPHLQYLFMSEDSIALQAYQKGELDFLRRLPTLYLSQWESSPELRKVTQVRFDYLALAPEFRDPAIAQSLAAAIDYAAWQKLYHAKPRPGCFGTPDEWTGGPLCWDFDPARAQARFAPVKKDPRWARLRLFYSRQGGDDHDRTMEFLQDQWRKNLGVEIPVEAQENKIYLNTVAAQKAPFFRKGLAPERLSCLAVLENFAAGRPENYLAFRDDEFEKIVQDLGRKPKDPVRLCRRGVEILKEKALLIPTGPIFFSILVKPGWQGVDLNALNQLDLSGLHREPVTVSK